MRRRASAAESFIAYYSITNSLNSISYVFLLRDRITKCLCVDFRSRAYTGYRNRCKNSGSHVDTETVMMIRADSDATATHYHLLRAFLRAERQAQHVAKNPTNSHASAATVLRRTNRVSSSAALARINSVTMKALKKSCNSHPSSCRVGNVDSDVVVVLDVPPHDVKEDNV